ncbi:trypsin-like serine peptidase [Spirillospora sp. CA-294931]|uniref:trypsin-like serine peptidase n=1 Tax=Spirillospora sp. CA-294931 TaxID=3240042 RepID=UPI003D8FA215
MSARRCFLVVPAALLVAGTSGVADAAATAPAPPDPRSVLAYWTAERMVSAQPESEPARRPAPSGTPTGGSVAPALPVELTAASRPYTEAGERVHGKVFYTKNGRDTWCSASSVTAANKSLVWTASHCVGGTTNVMYAPAYNSDGGGGAPYGRWPARKVATSGNDHAVVVVHPLNGQSLQDVVGANGIRFNGPIDRRTTIWGYPAARVWTGRDLTYCDQPTSPSGSSTRTACDTEGGSSGGGYITGTSTPTGLGSLWANHTAGDGGWAIGSVFGTTARNLYTANAGGPPPGGEVGAQ